jgi:hypothetical protein
MAMPILLGIAFALTSAACGLFPGERVVLLPRGENLPDREIMFLLADPAAVVLGFVNSNASGYVTREVSISEGLPGEILPLGGRILTNWFTWSPDGKSLAGKIGNTIAPSGIPFIISETGEATACSQTEELPYGPGRPWVMAGTTVLTVSYSPSSLSYDVKSMDVRTCRELGTLYSGAQGEAIQEAVLSSKGWLAIERWVGSGPKEILVMNTQSEQVAIMAEGQSPSWSRDGERVAFAVSSDGIYIANKDGSSIIKVVDDPTADYPSWSPDALWLAYQRVNPSGGGTGIAKVNLNTYETEQLAASGFYPSWRWTEPGG